MNVAVINLKGISKHLIKFILTIVLMIFIINHIFTNINSLKKYFSFKLCSSLYTSFFEVQEFEKSNINHVGLLKLFNTWEVASINKEADIVENDLNNGYNFEENIVISKNIGDANIEKVEEKNISEQYNLTYANVKIRNQSDYELSDEIFSLEDMIPLTSKKIAIYHTHTCESYTPSEKYNYFMTGNYRTTDNNYNVVKLGNELAKNLEERGFEIIHDSSYHDYPSYNGSYERSLGTIEKVLSENPDIQLVIDLHRDAVGDGSSYGPTVKIDGNSVAQMMFVIGTDGGGLKHPNWKQNVKTAIKLQSVAEDIYPGLFRPIIIRNSRYNQHVSSGACIIEVGATANTLDECLLSMQCLSNILEEAFKQ